MKVLNDMRDLSALMNLEERRVLTIAFRALTASRDNERNADAILARIDELNRIEDEKYDAEQERCAGVSR